MFHCFTNIPISNFCILPLFSSYDWNRCLTLHVELTCSPTFNMYIKKIIIEGFRTYRNKTVLCLEPGLNVIVGRNGSGKTNLLCAIQFVLAHEFHQLSPSERKNLLHISAGFHATSAYVEIIFNNEDKRLPEEGDEMSLRREITSAKDVFYVNGHSVTKEQVLNTLQSAGLSKANPYYIIKQGTINDLATATDKKRLELITEVAGSLVWKELQPQNYSLLKDAEAQMAQLEEFIGETEEHMSALEKDEQLYRSWSESNTKKRVLEWLLGKKEKDRLRSRITDMKKKLDLAQDDQNLVINEFMKCKGKVTDADKCIKDYQADIRTAEGKLKSLKEIGEDLVTENSKLELELADRKSLITDNTERLNEDLLQVEAEISLHQNELSMICDDYNSAVQEEHEVNARLMLSEQRRQQLFAKLGRGTLFSTIEERNQWIKEEQSKISTLVFQGEEKLHYISEGMKREESKAKELEIVIKRLEVEKITYLESLKQLNRDKQTLLLEQRRLQMSRSELRRKESEVREQWQESHDKSEHLKCEFIRRQNRICNPMHIDFILGKMRQEGPHTPAFKMAAQYRGLVIDHFTCDDILINALDAVGGNKLFHSVVDTADAASEILKWINREPYENGIGLPGTFCFYPLDKIRHPNIITGFDENEALPFMSKLHLVNESMRVAVEQVFGKILLCRSFPIALKAAKIHSINCVTLEGDKASWDGVLNGGYRNPGTSRSKIYFDLKKTVEEEKFKLSCLHEVETQIKEVDCKCNDIVSQLQRVENKISQTKMGILEEDLMKQRGALLGSKQAMEGKNALIRKMQLSLEANRAQLRMLEDELQQEFVSELGLEERAEVESLHEDIHSAKKMYQNVNVGRLELEGKKSILESRLNDHLMRKKQDLEQAIHVRSVCGLDRTEANQQAIRDIEAHLKNLDSSLKRNKDEISAIENKITELTNSIVEERKKLDKFSIDLQKQEILLEKSRAVTNKLQETINRNKAAEEVITSTMVTLENVDSENQKKIVDHYRDYNVTNLEKELTLVSDQLKRFKGVNQKATVECAFTKEKLGELNDRMIRLRSSHAKCIDLITYVKSLKNDAIQYSLMQVARSFRSMFKTLVPSPGIGYLKWTYDDCDSESDSEEEDDPRIPDVDVITGIAFKVSFTGTSIVQNVNSLSGGQRSVLSLALVFAFLMMDRAPFYLLDEADMALDKAYRSKVASMVDKFSQRSQFVAITFRPELLPYADNIIGVSFDAATQTSRAASITKEEANDFVSSHGSASSNISSSRSPFSSGSSTGSSRTVELVLP